MKRAACTGWVVLLILLPLIVHADYNRRLEALQLYQEGLFQETGTGDLKMALQIYTTIWENYKDYRDVAAVTLYHLGLVNEKLGKPQEAEYYYRIITVNYVDQEKIIKRVKLRTRTGSAPENEAALPVETRLASLRSKFKLDMYPPATGRLIEMILKKLVSHESLAIEYPSLSLEQIRQLQNAYYLVWDQCKGSQDLAMGILYELGWLHEQAGEYQEAAKYYRLILTDYNPKTPIARQAEAKYKKYQEGITDPPDEPPGEDSSQ